MNIATAITIKANIMRATAVRFSSSFAKGNAANVPPAPPATKAPNNGQISCPDAA